MFQYLFIFYRHLFQEPAWKLNRLWLWEGDLLYSTGPHTPEIGSGVGKKWRWMDWKARNWDKEEIPGSKQSTHGCILTHSRLKCENICQLLVLNRRDLNFWVHSSPLWDGDKTRKREFYVCISMLWLHFYHHHQATRNRWIYREKKLTRMYMLSK